jgi:hypothetical protein
VITVTQARQRNHCSVRQVLVPRADDSTAQRQSQRLAQQTEEGRRRDEAVLLELTPP